MKVFEFRIFRLTFYGKSISLKMLNKGDYNSVSDYFSDYLNTFKNLNMNFLIFVGILQV